MNQPETSTTGSARDEATRRRSLAVREARGMGPAPKPEPETGAVPERDDKPSK